jgi:hypothetical protein
MKFMTSLTALLLTASSIVLAAPVHLAGRDVWVPKILEPTAATVWHVGETYDITWALDQEPEQVTNPVGKVYLSKDSLLDIGA